MRGGVVALALVTLALTVPSGLAQVQPDDGVDASGLKVRDEVAAAGDLQGARRVLRFVQVSDAHILDDDAPYPLRQEPLDVSSTPFTAAQRPQEEYTDEVLQSAIQSINTLHAQDALQFVLNTGDNIDNELENELMRFIDLWEGSTTTTGPVSGRECVPDGQSESVTDTAHDEADTCTSLPAALAANSMPLVAGLPWYSAFGNHDGLIQGNVPVEPGFQDIAAQRGRHFLLQHDYVAMHFAGARSCLAGTPAGGPHDDMGHGYGYAADRLCDADLSNDGYYSFTQNGVRFVVLDTVNDDFVTANNNLAGTFDPQGLVGNDLAGGYSEGSVDPIQFEWLKAEIADHPDELIGVTAHHTVNSMFLEPASSTCGGPGCLGDLLRQSGYKTGQDVIDLLAASPNVGAFVGGHTHRHKVEPKSTADGAFWNIESASLIDMPQEARLIELWVTANGTKGFWTLREVTHDFNVSRELAALDPQRDPGFDGTDLDRSVLLWFDLAPTVRLEAQPEPVRLVRLDLVAPTQDSEGFQGTGGTNVTLVVRATQAVGPKAGQPVPGLVVLAHGPLACPDKEGRLPAIAGSIPFVADPAHPGNYTATANLPGCTHYLSLAASDPSGRFPDAVESASLSLRPSAGDNVETDTPALMPATVLLALALVFMARRRHQP